ncbi:hypothetical protein BDB00DRAFT_841920 [Zychaea mexicana]|uniref:uncharacterized protein n=1 Tax=Zychaea mexicana TaxID=64656 RepID=UPI0022FDBACC|nr:uncharacterized protein BDB00DRAFT_841920 [Zychaea mexicana]KAI9489665.1 hypothetical protein BDB00DRAFT_841920 [Zychaea mexicana]
MVHTHLRMKTYVMDVPDGYVCRIREIKQQQIPETLIDFYETYIPYLEAMLKIKGIVKSTMDVVAKPKKNRSDFVSSVTEPSTVIIPSALNGPVKITPQKRKADDSECSHTQEK